MDVSRARRDRKALALVALLGGGSTLTSCDTRIKQAVVGGLETTFLSLFDASLYVNADQTGSTQGGGLFDE